MASFFYKHFLKSNVFIGLCTCFFYLTGLSLLSENTELPPFGLFGILFLSSFLIYSISQKSNFFIESSWKKFIIRNWSILIAIPFLLYFSTLLTFKEWILFMVLGLISFLYNSVEFKNKSVIPLRGIPLLKVFLIAFVWTGVGVALPAIHLDFKLKWKLIVLVFSQFFFILAITLPFDIRDFYKDYRNNLITLPAVIGISNTRKFAYGSLVLHFLGLLVFQSWLAIFYLPFVAIVFLFVKKADASKPNYYYIFFIDGLIILQFFVIYLLTRW